MESRALGQGGPQVSLVGLGTNNFAERLDLEASRAVLDRALELGITFLDTSDVYGGLGGTETFLGELLGATLDTSVTVVSPNGFLGLIGINNFTYNLKSQVSSGIGTLESALVLDNTGSMSGSKITTLKTAAGVAL